MSPTSTIFQLFGRSPIRPLQEHMERVHSCTQRLFDFINASQSEDWEAATQLQQQVATLEEDADQLKHDIRQHLPKNFFLPAPRVDLLQVLAFQDKIANRAKDIAGLILGRRMLFPKSVLPEYLKLLQRCIDTAGQAYKAIDELDSLLEAGFKGQEADFVEKLIVQLDTMEHDTDEIQVKVRQELFAVEKDYPPIDIMFLYKIIDWTGDLADRAQKLGGQLEIIIAR